MSLHPIPEKKKERMASLFRKLGHVTKKAVKFRYDMEVVEALGLPPQGGTAVVVWDRGPRTASTSIAVISSDGKASFNKQTLSMIVTLYSKGGSSGFDPKMARISLRYDLESGKVSGKGKKLGSVDFDLAAVATAEGKATELVLALTGVKAGAGASLRPSVKVLVKPVFLKEYTGEEDAMSQRTDLSRWSLGKESSSEALTDRMAEFDDTDSEGEGGPSPMQQQQQHTPTKPATPYAVQVTASSPSQSATAPPQPQQKPPLARPPRSPAVAGSGSSGGDTARLRGLEEANALLRAELSALQARAEAMRSEASRRAIESDELVTQVQDEARKEREKASLAAFDLSRSREEVRSLRSQIASLETVLEAVRAGVNDKEKGAAATTPGQRIALGQALAVQLEASHKEVGSLQGKNDALRKELRDLQQQLFASQELAGQREAETRILGEELKAVRVQLSRIAATTGHAGVGLPDRGHGHDEDHEDGGASSRYALEEQLLSARIACSQFQSEVVETRVKVKAATARAETAEKSLEDVLQQLIQAKIQVAELHTEKTRFRHLAGVLGKRVTDLEVKYESVR
jgi:hypothetical protein